MTIVRDSRRLVVLTGAGCSTASGIPDYRSPNGSYSRGHKPIQHAEFVGSADARRRYWTRSFVGWNYFSRAAPNVAHKALAELEARGFIDHLITQNVDGLHCAAGHERVLDLHGRIDSVVCLQCGDLTPRAALQERLHAANARWAAQIAPRLKAVELRADGDSEIEAPDDFAVPSCMACTDGMLKPAVTFFGGSLDAWRAQAAADAIDAADALLVVGSSLQTFSAFRLARAAARAAAPVAILNNGPTRADDLASLRVAADACEVLPALLSELSKATMAPS